MVENLLQDICSAYDFSATCFRYLMLPVQMLPGQ